MANIMFHQYLVLLTILLGLFSKTSAEYCNGLICDSCCPDGTSCCNYDYTYTWNIWNMWYFWFIIIFVLLSCFGGCGYWRRRRVLLQQRHMATTGVTVTTGIQPTPHFQGGYTHNTTTYGTPGVPPNMVGPPATGMYNGPPAYTEVMSKPNQYPQPVDKSNLPPYAAGPMASPYPQGPGVAPPYPTGPNGAVPPPYTSPTVPSSQSQGDPSQYPQPGAAPYQQAGAAPYQQAGAAPYPQQGAAPYQQQGAAPYPQ